MTCLVGVFGVVVVVGLMALSFVGVARASDAIRRRISGAHAFGPVVPFPDRFVKVMRKRAKRARRELLLDLGFVRWNEQDVSILLRRHEFPHFFVLGRTGSGKSYGTHAILFRLLASAKRLGVPINLVYLTPHYGDAVGILPLLAETKLQTAFVDLSGQIGGSTGWSPFVPRHGSSAEEVANRCLQILGSAFAKDFSATPELRAVLHTAIYVLVVDERLTIDMVPDVLADPEKGKLVLPKITAPNVARFLKRLWGMAEGTRNQIVRHAIPKFHALVSSETVRWTLSQERSHLIDLGAFLDHPGVLLFHPGTQRIGDLGNVFASLFLEDVRLRLMARNPATAPLTLFVVDEVAELVAKGGAGVAESLSLLLSGARKQGCQVFLLAQDLHGQIADRRLASHLLSQTSKLVFQLGRNDAKDTAREIVLPPERPILWPGDWSCEGAHVGSLDPEKWLGPRTKKDHEADTYFKLLSLPPRACYVQTTIDGILETRLVYTHDRPDPVDPAARPRFVGMRPLDVVRAEVESREAPWEGASSTPSAGGAVTTGAPGASPKRGGAKRAAPPTWT